jgi:hypothetical protein
MNENRPEWGYTKRSDASELPIFLKCPPPDGSSIIQPSIIYGTYHAVRILVASLAPPLQHYLSLSRIPQTKEYKPSFRL